jgi:hypothetical protein
MLRIAYLLAVVMIPAVFAGEVQPLTPGQTGPSQNAASWSIYEAKAESVEREAGNASGDGAQAPSEMELKCQSKTMNV